MTTGRVLWIIWSLGWAGIWLAAAVLALGDPAVHSSAGWKLLVVLLAAGSVAAAFLPVGRE